ncbi:HalOD1 output domain-containing protein [Natrinema sp. H-ect4]|uniref:HalOD1 output domain-containing protein n=1 Tax=Natrinema sp. H-ect4 TaxID=3242699 RepID=UPI0035A89AD9
MGESYSPVLSRDTEIQREFDPDSSVGYAILEAIAELEGVDATNLLKEHSFVLSDHVDVDALNSLIDTGSSTEVRIRADDYVITVAHDVIHVARTEPDGTLGL